MPSITYKGVRFDCRDGESVLDASLRQNMGITFSCRHGTCQVCLTRCIDGTVPKRAQNGLRPGLIAKNYFLPCRCVPSGDMEIAPPRDTDLYSPAVVCQKDMLAPDVCRLLLEPATSLYYHAGQFINLRRPDGLARSYSLVSMPQEDYYLEVHVKRMNGGAMSNWIFDTLQTGDEIEIQGPNGRCYYAASDKTQPILLVATGTGLGALYGIARDALQDEHTGEIHLYHGSRHLQGLMLRDQLMELSARYGNFHYNGCVSGAEPPAGVLRGRAHEIGFGLHEQLHGWRVHLCGRPEMVHAAETLALRAGARPADIFADPFDLTDRRREARPAPSVSTERRTEPPPDPELWQALREGTLMRTILTDFYTRVFEDTRLAPYFRGVTRDRLIEKVYSFMFQFITGNKVYFGDRPRNAHHWMVISDELFDYREALMTECLRRHGMPEHLIKRWNAYEESFRPDIVKSSPWPRIVGGVALPVEGFEELILDVGSLCDGCQSEIHPGTRVRYHVRLGTTYCPACQSSDQ